jgi:hypothetical protein
MGRVRFEGLPPYILTVERPPVGEMVVVIVDVSHRRRSPISLNVAIFVAQNLRTYRYSSRPDTSW